jgi:hypothetical protein
MESDLEEIRRQHETPPVNASGSADLELLAYRLSLTPAERLAENERLVAFLGMVREAGARHHAGRAKV